MRGAGKPSFEHDLPPGSDKLREILEGPFAPERPEMELSSRLRGWGQRQDLAPEEGTRIELAVRDRHQMLTFFWFIACFMGLRESVRIGIFAARADPREASKPTPPLGASETLAMGAYFQCLGCSVNNKAYVLFEGTGSEFNSILSYNYRLSDPRKSSPRSISFLCEPHVSRRKLDSATRDLCPPQR
ncbi:predicted protein [Histoplasma capsulatum var. duboisii H88]|uniref:Predicted protein n=1 Tax=Ajellomyces capsulatus (strain H88) TaxID=544711 RepID=F0UQI3_AJEC8|nr:predicted protein [Histoplasma capsulatum var. duboisii H88]